MTEIDRLRESIRRGAADACDLVEAADLLAESGHEHGEILCELAGLIATTEDFAELRTYSAMFLDLAGLCPEESPPQGESQ